MWRRDHTREQIGMILFSFARFRNCFGLIQGRKKATRRLGGTTCVQRNSMKMSFPSLLKLRPWSVVFCRFLGSFWMRRKKPKKDVIRLPPHDLERISWKKERKWNYILVIPKHNLPSCEHTYRANFADRITEKGNQNHQKSPKPKSQSTLPFFNHFQPFWFRHVYFYPKSCLHIKLFSSHHMNALQTYPATTDIRTKISNMITECCSAIAKTKGATIITLGTRKSLIRGLSFGLKEITVVDDSLSTDQVDNKTQFDKKVSKCCVLNFFSSLI